MEDIRLPRHVIDRLENRWATRLQQEAKAWRGNRTKPLASSHVKADGARVIPVSANALAGPGLVWLEGGTRVSLTRSARHEHRRSSHLRMGRSAGLQE
jgi:hypothetical protein